MRSVVVIGAVAVLALSLFYVSTAEEPAFAQPPSKSNSVRQAESALIAMSFAAGETLQQVAVIDPHKRVLSVYHIDAGTGAIELKSVRKIEWDLEMIQFNGMDPLPDDIRSVIEQNR